MEEQFRPKETVGGSSPSRGTSIFVETADQKIFSDGCKTSISGFDFEIRVPSGHLWAEYLTADIHFVASDASSR